MGRFSLKSATSRRSIRSCRCRPKPARKAGRSGAGVRRSVGGSAGDRCPGWGFPVIRAALADLEFHVAGVGRLWPLDRRAFDATHQTCGHDPATGSYRLDVFREPRRDGTWRCRRDCSIQRRYSTLILRSAEGIPYLAPEIVLLFKARHCQFKDHDDLATAALLLTAPQRTWLTTDVRLRTAPSSRSRDVERGAHRPASPNDPAPLRITGTVRIARSRKAT